MTEEHYRQLRGLGFTQTDHRILFCGRSEFLRRRSTSFAGSAGPEPAFSRARAVQLESAEEFDEVRQDASVHIRVVYGYDCPRVIPIPTSGVTLGRGLSDVVEIRDVRVSRKHATIRFEWNTWRLSDLGSRNGSFVNGRLVGSKERAPLADGSVIRLGDTVAVFRTSPAADFWEPDDAPLGLPLLRERREDILPWAQRFLLEARTTAPTDVWSPGAAECLITYDWPGNLHELREVVRALVTESRSFPIDHSDLPENLTAYREALCKAKRTRDDEVPEPTPAAIEAALTETRGDTRRAANFLEIPRRTLYRLCRKHGIEIDRYRRPGDDAMPGENE